MAAAAEASGRPLRAVVLGGTGAVGRELVSQLLASPRWGSVTTLGRRAVDVPGAEAAQREGKLQQVVVPLDELESAAAAAEALRGSDSVFCALGTTRGAAGSAAAFKRVDFEYVAAAARAVGSSGDERVGQQRHKRARSPAHPPAHPPPYTCRPRRRARRTLAW